MKVFYLLGVDNAGESWRYLDRIEANSQEAAMKEAVNLYPGLFAVKVFASGTASTWRLQLPYPVPLEMRADPYWDPDTS